MCLAITSCATYKPAQKKEIQNKFEITKSYDETWSSVVKFFASKNIPIKVIDKSSGLIATDPMMYDTIREKNYFECDKFFSVGIEVPYPGKAIFNVFVEKTKTDATLITVNLTPTYVVPANQFGTGGERPCFSTGQYEKELLEKVK